MFKSFICAIAVLSITISIGVHADDHATQVLHPYWGNKDLFVRYLKAFKDPVNVEVLKYDEKNDPELNKDVFIYIYVINIPGPKYFSLDITCPKSIVNSVSGIEHLSEQSRIAKIRGVASDPVAKDPKAIITKSNRIVWKLKSTIQRHGMWFYSSSPPGKRGYRIEGKSFVKEGQISGPSCEPGSSYIEPDGSEKSPNDRIQPIESTPLKPTEYENYVRSSARKNGCAGKIDIYEISNKAKKITYKAICKDKILLFECEFGKRAACYLM